MAANESGNSPDDEIRELKLQNAKLARELRITQNYLDRVTKTMDAKDALEAALKTANIQQKAYTDMLLENCPNIIMLLDDYGRGVLSTKNFLTLTRLPNFDFIKNRPWDEVAAEYLPADDLAELKTRGIRVMARRKNISFMKWIDFGGTGKKRCYSIELMCIDQIGYEGAKKGILAVFLDMTDLMQEKQRAESANRAKSDFLAVMSHEIRTPMNAILGLNEILSRTELTEIQSRYLGDIKKSAQSLLAIINDILDFSKIEAGKLDIVNANYNLRLMLDNLQSMFGILFRGKNLSLDFKIDPELSVAVFGDENRTRQVLTNLLSNALKYTHKGHVEFSARIEKNEGNVLLRFDVQDTGIGIRKEDAQKIFNPFEQLDTRKNRNVVGTGLGLTICQRLCRLMGGNLRFQSEYGKGSTFSVELPYVPAEIAAHVEADEERAFSAPQAKILVVDDIEINLEVCSAMLASFDIDADIASSGREAVQKAWKKNYDLIFMDYMMPEMDGIETTSLIRSLGDNYAKIPIVALTANVIGGAEQMFLENRFNALLAKPIEFRSLSQCLRKWLPQEMILDIPSNQS